MPEYVIRGLTVNFPHNAYPCQLMYMEKVIEALDTGRFALLESPTGTGKTLCLLCSTMAWIGRAKAKRYVSTLDMTPGREALVSALGLSPDAAATASASSDPNMKPRDVPKIVYTSRTHSQLAQVIREMKRTSYRAKICVLGSREQLCLHPDVKKSRGNVQNIMCRSLVSARSCSFHERLKARVSNPIAGMASAPDAPPPLPALPGNAPAIPGGASGSSSSSDIFVSESVAQAEDMADIEDLVRIGQEAGICPFYLSRDSQASAEVLFLPYNYVIDPRLRSSVNLDLENCILICDEAHNLESVCSDSSSFDLTAAILASCITETQRVIDLLRLSSSPSPSVVAGQPPSESEQVVEMAQLKAWLLKMEEELDKIELPPATAAEGITKKGAWIYDFFATLGIEDAQTANWLIEVVDKAITTLSEEREQLGLSSSSSSSGNRNSSSLQYIADALKLLYCSDVTKDAIDQFYRVHIHLELEKHQQVSSAQLGLYMQAKKSEGKLGSRDLSKGKTLSLWCFSPGIAMKSITDCKPHSVIFTSGTLSPLDSFALEFRTEFPIRLENPHIITAEQVTVMVAQKGPTGVALNSSFKTREDSSYKQDLGNLIVNMARFVPDGLLVFFPSYGVLTSCINFWKLPQLNGAKAVWDLLIDQKHCIVEPKESSLCVTAIQEFEARIAETDTPSRTKNGAIFFAVCRGKVSEGLDFANRNGRAVIVTGLPFPNKSDARVILKQSYLDEMNRMPKSSFSSASFSSNGKTFLTGIEWYMQQASRAVNQAIGRVIRHVRDYGAVILADERFAQTQNRNQLSKWLRDHVKTTDKFGEVVQNVVPFFRNAAQKFPYTAPPPSAIAAPTPRSISPNTLPSASSVMKKADAAALASSISSLGKAYGAPSSASSSASSSSSQSKAMQVNQLAPSFKPSQRTLQKLPVVISYDESAPSSASLPFSSSASASSQSSASKLNQVVSSSVKLSNTIKSTVSLNSKIPAKSQSNNNALLNVLMSGNKPSASSSVLPPPSSSQGDVISLESLSSSQGVDSGISLSQSAIASQKSARKTSSLNSVGQLLQQFHESDSAPVLVAAAASQAPAPAKPISSLKSLFPTQTKEMEKSGNSKGKTALDSIVLDDNDDDDDEVLEVMKPSNMSSSASSRSISPIDSSLAKLPVTAASAVTSRSRTPSPNFLQTPIFFKKETPSADSNGKISPILVGASSKSKSMSPSSAPASIPSRSAAPMDSAPSSQSSSASSSLPASQSQSQSLNGNNTRAYLENVRNSLTTAEYNEFKTLLKSLKEGILSGKSAPGGELYKQLALAFAQLFGTSRIQLARQLADMVKPQYRQLFLDTLQTCMPSLGPVPMSLASPSSSSSQKRDSSAISTQRTTPPAADSVPAKSANSSFNALFSSHGSNKKPKPSPSSSSSL